MKVTIKNFNVDWLEIKNACRTTISMNDSNVEPTTTWKRKLLIARHSPIRIGTVLVKVENIPYCNMGHFVRHNQGFTPFVSTSREDRTGKPREERKQTDLVNMEFLANIEALINISAKRLCTCADKKTIEIWKEVLKAIKEYDEDIYWACTPQCVQSGGCKEPFNECKFYENIMRNASKEEQMNLMKRYDRYNIVRNR